MNQERTEAEVAIEVLKLATETRRFEIERLWQRSLFFWGFVGVAFVGFTTLLGQGADSRALLGVSCLGAICSLSWSLQNRGSKYWQEAWEAKVERAERDALGRERALFGKIEPVQEKGWLGARRYSVSRLAIALSDFTLACWLVAIWVESAPDLHRTIDLVKTGIVASSAIFALLVLVLARSGSRVDGASDVTSRDADPRGSA